MFQPRRLWAIKAEIVTEDNRWTVETAITTNTIEDAQVKFREEFNKDFTHLEDKFDVLQVYETEDAL